MIYEERVYKIMPGRMPDIIKRFQEHAVRLFERHGIKLVGFWQPVIGPSFNEIYYLVAYEDLEHRERAWTAFINDPEWIRVRAETEKNGPLVADISNRILKPAAFSPLQ